MGSKIQIDALSTGAGDIKLCWNANDPMEVERAKRVIEDMLKRGYALFIQSEGGKLTKVKRFKPDTCEYVIAAGATIDPELARAVEKARPADPPEAAVKMSRSKVIAVGRSAGG